MPTHGISPANTTFWNCLNLFTMFCAVRCFVRCVLARGCTYQRFLRAGLKPLKFSACLAASRAKHCRGLVEVGIRRPKVWNELQFGHFFTSPLQVPTPHVSTQCRKKAVSWEARLREKLRNRFAEPCFNAGWQDIPICGVLLLRLLFKAGSWWIFCIVWLMWMLLEFPRKPGGTRVVVRFLLPRPKLWPRARQQQQQQQQGFVRRRHGHLAPGKNNNFPNVFDWKGKRLWKNVFDKPCLGPITTNWNMFPAVSSFKKLQLLPRLWLTKGTLLT